MMTFKADYQRLAERLTGHGINIESIKAALKKQHIETPSWEYDAQKVAESRGMVSGGIGGYPG